MANVAFYLLIIMLLATFFFSKNLWLNVLLLTTLWCCYYIKNNAGVDTYIYKIRYQNIQDGFMLFYEPLLNFVMYLVKGIGFSWNGFIATYSVFYLIFLKKALSVMKVGNSYLVFLFLYIGIDSTFNGLRIGLAFMLFLLVKKGILKYLPLLAHSTFLYVISRKYVFFIIPILLFIDRVELPEILVHKFVHYETATTVASYSGIVIFFAVLLLRLGVRDRLFSRLQAIGVYFLTAVFYFGNVLFVRLVFLEFYHLIANKEQRNSWNLLLVSGVLFINFLRQILTSFNNIHGWAVFE